MVWLQILAPGSSELSAKSFKVIPSDDAGATIIRATAPPPITPTVGNRVLIVLS
jgi:hypothetical protein